MEQIVKNIRINTFTDAKKALKESAKRNKQGIPTCIAVCYINNVKTYHLGPRIF